MVGLSRTRFRTNSRHVLGHAHWGHHYASLSSSFGLRFGLGYGGFGSWGCYSYPYYFGATLPSYYSQCYGGLGYSYRNYGFGLGFWLWPRYCYYPSRWIFGSSIWSDPYDLYYSPTRTYVVVDGTSAPSDEEVIVVGDAESRPSDTDADAESKLEIARRHIALGDFYFRDGRFKDAAESYMRGLSYAPEDGSLHFLIADALFAQGDYHYAAHMIQKGIELDPTLALVDVDKREFYGEATTFEAQMITLRGYLEDKPYDAAAHLVLGYNLKFSADAKGAKAAFERVLEIQPGDHAATAFLEAASESR